MENFYHHCVSELAPLPTVVCGECSVYVCVHELEIEAEIVAKLCVPIAVAKLFRY